MVKTLKNSFPFLLIGVVLGLVVLAIEPAIRFFFRGFLLLLENPLEGLAFFGIIGVFVSIWIYFTEK